MFTTNKNVIHILGLGVLVAFMAGCSSIPKVTDAKVTAVYPYPINDVHKGVVNVLTVIGYKIKKQEPNYIEGVLPSNPNFGHNTDPKIVGVWLIAQASDKTEVKVRSLTWGLGSKGFDKYILTKLTRGVKEEFATLKWEAINAGMNGAHLVAINGKAGGDKWNDLSPGFYTLEVSFHRLEGVLEYGGRELSSTGTTTISFTAQAWHNYIIRAQTEGHRWWPVIYDETTGETINSGR